MGAGASVFTQILLGSIGLGLSSAIHIVVLLGAIGLLRKIHYHIDHSVFLKPGLLMAAALTAVIFGHTVQVWLWAGAFLLAGALPTVADAIYFSLVTYTTVGYGDVTVGAGTRIFAATAAVTGVLNFGLSTAFLVRLVARLWPNELSNRE